ncbi:MAG: hypothetical protein HOO96_23865 [Polyangiaceae bacterium]|nr:hypothetical protein [Polyangiaceae bacterium]
MQSGEQLLPYDLIGACHSAAREPSVSEEPRGDEDALTAHLRQLARHRRDAQRRRPHLLWTIVHVPHLWFGAFSVVDPRDEDLYADALVAWREAARRCDSEQRHRVLRNVALFLQTTSLDAAEAFLAEQVSPQTGGQDVKHATAELLELQREAEVVLHGMSPSSERALQLYVELYLDVRAEPARQRTYLDGMSRCAASARERRYVQLANRAQGLGYTEVVRGYACLLGGQIVRAAGCLLEPGPLEPRVALAKELHAVAGRAPIETFFQELDARMVRSIVDGSEAKAC